MGVSPMYAECMGGALMPRMTYLCVPIFVTDAEQAKRDAILAAEAGAEMVELRIDQLTAPIELPEMPLPYIVTCRPTWEGGESTLDDQERLDLLATMAQRGAAYMDVELETYIRRPDVSDLTMKSTRLIVSAHDFKGRPKLGTLRVLMAERLAHVHKLVWMARSIRDNLEAFELLKTPVQPTIALCMGEAGGVSAGLAKKFGAFLTFASLMEESGAAPGEGAVSDMKRGDGGGGLGRQQKGGG